MTLILSQSCSLLTIYLLLFSCIWVLFSYSLSLKKKSMIKDLLAYQADMLVLSLQWNSPSLIIPWNGILRGCDSHILMWLQTSLAPPPVSVPWSYPSRHQCWDWPVWTMGTKAWVTRTLPPILCNPLLWWMPASCQEDAEVPGRELCHFPRHGSGCRALKPGCQPPCHPAGVSEVCHPRTLCGIVHAHEPTTLWENWLWNSKGYRCFIKCSALSDFP